MALPMNPAQKLASWFRGPDDPKSVEAQRLRDERDTIRISQNTGISVFGPINVPPTPDVLDPGREDSRSSD
ncbi:MAG: hypothetical protein ABI797_08260 [Chloroflexota bacterium]